MIPHPAQYLLRFDDLCPTLDRGRWQRFLPLIAEFGIRPILAVVPENQDAKLEFAPPDPEFWAGMRALQDAGATIAMHGYRHLCSSRGKGLLPLHSKSEFAGVHAELQWQWIHSGLETLRSRGLNPKLWVAPRHGFDRNTLRALRREGIKVLSDGFARVPFTRGGLLWIPQQLWSPVDKRSGLWTVCIHPNSARSSDLEQLEAFLRGHAAQFTSVDRVVSEYPHTGLDLLEKIYAAFALWRNQLARLRKRSRQRAKKFR